MVDRPLVGRLVRRVLEGLVGNAASRGWCSHLFIVHWFLSFRCCGVDVLVGCSEVCRRCELWMGSSCSVVGGVDVLALFRSGALYEGMECER